MTRIDREARGRDREVLGFRLRRLDLVHARSTFLRRRGIEHQAIGGVLVHRLDAADPGIDLHDHPWAFLTFVVRGGYTEEVAPISAATRWAIEAERVGHPRSRARRGRRRTWRRWSIHRMPLDVAHRIVAVEPDTVTLVLRGPRVRVWGFHQPTGWVPWTDYDYETRRPVHEAR